MSVGWDESAAAWIADMGEAGDFGRRCVLDRPMLDRVRRLRPQNALDVGCGEGRFCRMLRHEGVNVVGIDPTAALLEQAQRLDPAGVYQSARAEQLPFEDDRFDLAVSYLTLIDIPDYRAAISEMVRVVRPGGTLLAANLASFCTAAVNRGWTTDAQGDLRFMIDDYLDEREQWVEWRDIRVKNWHRPLSAYMTAFLDRGLELRYFAEPEAYLETTTPKARLERRIPWFVIMEWRKPEARLNDV